MRYLFYNSSQRMEYDSNSLMGICSSVAVLRQSLMAARTSSIISFASCCSSTSANTQRQNGPCHEHVRSLMFQSLRERLGSQSLRKL